MTNSIAEIENTELMLVIGSNPTEAHPIIGNKMLKAKRNGAKLIVVDPRQTELAKQADIWLAINSGTDIVLINCMLRIIIENRWLDMDYITKRCENFEDLLKNVASFNLDYASRVCGIPQNDIVEAARLYANTDKASIYYTLGITEHSKGTANVMALSNLGLATGHIGREGCGVNPLRGQNNVQGSCDMGALPDTYPAYQKVVDVEARGKFEKLWNTKLSSKVGLMIPEMFEEAIAGRLKAMYIMGEDPVLTDPDSNNVKKAFANMDFVVVQDIFMSETAKYADIILPASSYAEKDGTFTNTERRVQRVRKAVNTPGEAREDWSIICDIAKGMGAVGFDFASPSEIFEEIRLAAPSYSGITYDRIDKAGLQWPCTSEDQPGTKFLHKGNFTRGKGVFKVVEYKEAVEMPDNDYPVLLTTGRMLYHYNITTRFSAALDNLRPHELAWVNPREAKLLNIKDGDTIQVSSRRGSVVTRVMVTDKIKAGMIWMSLHFKESPVNELTIEAHDPITLTGEYKICAVRLEKVSLKKSIKPSRFINMKKLV